jgi:tRNA(adenine34) deaminase
MNDEHIMQQAIALALRAEKEGNLPIGAVIALDGEVIAGGRNAIWVPVFDATRHAEMEALRAVPKDLWRSAGAMSLYTTLEPCLMCFASILLHRIGRVVYGSADPYGGANTVLQSLPPYFSRQLRNTEWLGPAFPADCDPLYERIKALEGIDDSQRH